LNSETSGDVEKILPSRDVHLLWLNIPKFTSKIGRSYVDLGYTFEANVSRFLETRLRYIPYVTFDEIKGLSGIIHKNDGMFVRSLRRRKDVILLECKCHERLKTARNEIMVFNQKSRDIFFALKKRDSSLNLYRVFVSAGPVDRDVLLYGLTYGILVLQAGPTKKMVTSVPKTRVQLPLEQLPPIESCIILLDKHLKKDFETKRLIQELKLFRTVIFRKVEPNKDYVAYPGSKLLERYIYLAYQAMLKV
jgi:hypothetical protein